MLSRQEMFERAVRGLASQNWEQCVYGHGLSRSCVYFIPGDVPKRCAWGWVDPEGTQRDNGSVHLLRVNGIGLAAELDMEGESFAMALQNAHDGWDESKGPMAKRFETFARTWNLTWPADVAVGL